MLPLAWDGPTFLPLSKFEKRRQRLNGVVKETLLPPPTVWWEWTSVEGHYQNSFFKIKIKIKTFSNSETPDRCVAIQKRKSFIKPISSMDFTPPSHRSEPRSRTKSASRLAIEADQIPHFSVDAIASPRKKTPSLPFRNSCFCPLPLSGNPGPVSWIASKWTTKL